MNLLLVWTAVCGILGVGPDEGDARQAEAVTFRIPENSPPGARVGVVPHADGAARFELLGDDSAPFAVDTATGRISVRDGKSLDFEDRAEYRLTVRVTTVPPAPSVPPPAPDEDPLWQSFAERLGEEDSELFAPREQPAPQAEIATEQHVVVQIVDVNEPPSIAAQRFDASMIDSAPAVVGSLTAADPDAGERLTFAVVAGDKAAAFQINPESGRLTIHPERLPLGDAERAVIRVRVTDRGGLTSEADLTVELPRRPTPPPVASDPPVEAPRPLVVAPPVEAPRPQVFAQGTGPSLAGGDPNGTRPMENQPNQTRPNGAQPVGPTVEVVPRPAPPTTRPVTAAVPVWRRWLAGGVSPLLIVLTGLLAALAHVLRVRALRRQWSRITGRNAGQAGESSISREDLEAAFEELAGQRQMLADDIAQLSADQALLADEQRQLEREREELAALEVQLAAAEAELADVRSALEQERRKLEAERTELEQRARQEASRRYGAGEDLYAVDEEQDATLRGRDPGTSTWVDPADTTEDLEQDPELNALRSNLAEMLGGSMDSAATAETPPSGNAMTPLAPHRTVAAGSRDSLYRPSAPPAPGGSKEGEGDSISSYMEALMKRLRQNGGAPASGAAAPRAQSVAEEWSAATPPAAATAARPAVAPAAAATASKPAAPPQPAPAPRPKVDKTAVRDKVNSLREVANLSARSAMATYVRRKQKRRGVLVGVVYVALLALAAALLAGVLGAPIADGAQRWLILGMGAVVILHYVSSICLADFAYGRPDRRYQRRKPVPPVADEATPQTSEPHAEQPARLPARRSAADADGTRDRGLVGSAAADRGGSGAN